MYENARSGKDVKIPYSHEGVARTDRIYISNELLSEEFLTKSTYIGNTILFQEQIRLYILFIFVFIFILFIFVDNPGQNDHCLVEISSAEEMMKMENSTMNEQMAQVPTVGMGQQRTDDTLVLEAIEDLQNRLMEKLGNVLQRIEKQDKEIENMKNSLKDIKASI